MSDGFVPPQRVRANARRGLELRAKHNRGGTMVGVARARDLANGRSLSRSTIARMVSYFARHEVDKKGKDWGNQSHPSAGYIAWLLWGGDAGRAWANSIHKKEKTVQTTVFAPILKAEKQEDGSILVTGVATDSTLDIDEQVCDGTWLKDAMPKWFKWGNIREQHSSIAAGVATEYQEQDGKHLITARIIDKGSVKKIEAGVLKGFSIGIRNPRVVKDEKAAGGRITDGEIVEVSVVDRPANPECLLTIAKTVDGEMVQVEELIETGKSATKEDTMADTEKADAPDEQGHDDSVNSGEESCDCCEQCGEGCDGSCCKECKAFVEKENHDDSMKAAEKAARKAAKKAYKKALRKAAKSVTPQEPDTVETPADESVEDETAIDAALEKMSKRLRRIEKSLNSLVEAYETASPEAIAKSVTEVAERVAVVEKSASRGPARLAPLTKNVAPASNTVAETYRAKAAATTDRALAEGYLLLAREAETTNPKE